MNKLKLKSNTVYVQDARIPSLEWSEILCVMERFMQEKKLFATKKESSNKALLNFEKKNKLSDALKTYNK